MGPWRRGLEVMAKVNMARLPPTHDQRRSATASSAQNKNVSSVLTLVALGVIASIECRKLSSCQVAAELTKHGIQQHELSKWVCIAMGESSGNTAAVNPTNTDGSKDYGLLQINNRYWCGENGPAGGCKIPCKALLDDNIADDVKCARIIEKAQGLDAWVAWKQKCKNGQFSKFNIKPC